MSDIPADFPLYDPAIAEAMTSTGRSYGRFSEGLPGYLKMTISEVGPGWLTCHLPVTEELLNPFGAAHGGVVSALVDHALGAVCLPVVAPGTWPATQEFKLNFLAPVRVGLLVARSTIVSLTKRTAVVTVEIENLDRLVCTALGTVAILAPR